MNFQEHHFDEENGESPSDYQQIEKDDDFYKSSNHSEEKEVEENSPEIKSKDSFKNEASSNNGTIIGRSENSRFSQNTFNIENAAFMQTEGIHKENQKSLIFSKSERIFRIAFLEKLKEEAKEMRDASLGGSTFIDLTKTISNETKRKKSYLKFQIPLDGMCLGSLYSAF